ncbi:hypothetical protein ES703_102012 [subsurface metagenome]
MEEEETELARELRIGRAEEVIAKREARIRQIRDQLGKVGMTEEERKEEEKRKAEEELKGKMERIEQAKALYTSCVEASGDPKKCAEMVAGLIPSPTAPAAAPPATSITELIQALKTLDELRGSDKGLAELKQSFDNLAQELRGGNTNKKPLDDPITFAKQQAEALSAWHKVLQDITPAPPPVSDQGEPLEVVKERNRHNERMEEVKADREYKGRITEIAADIPERIGRGIAGHIGEGESGGHSGGELEYITCTEEGCGAKIFITPESGQLECPKCGTIYKPRETTKSRAE